MSNTSLTVAYKPQALAGIRGQPGAVLSLGSFVASPYPCSFLFHGPSGVGKTATAFALAREIGVAVDAEEMGGLYEIPAGQQDGAAVCRLMNSLAMRPMMGSGWKLVIVNEADCMTRQAEMIWLDALESLPRNTIVVFTTNEIGRLSERFLGRCEIVPFYGDRESIGDAVDDLIREVWLRETGKQLRRIPEGAGCLDLFSRTLSFRLALQQLQPYIRTGQELPERFGVPLMRDAGEGKSGKGSRPAPAIAANRPAPTAEATPARAVRPVPAVEPRVSSEAIKHCPRCDRDMPVSEFGSNKNRKDGLTDRCRVCQRSWRQERANQPAIGVPA